MADYVTKPDEITYLNGNLNQNFEDITNLIRTDLDEVFNNTKIHINSLNS